MSTSPNRIEKKALLRAKRERVWRAISDAKEFGAWFGVAFDGPFVAGQRITGTLAPTKVDPDVAKSQASYAGAAFELVVDRIEAMHLFSFRWHPFAIDKNVDYSKEQMTTVVFELAEAEGGTMLTITESGFEGVDLARRAKAFEMNDGGWTAQMKLVAKYVSDAT